MYYPYLRGKQFELIALRELASKMPNAQGVINPIVEPVRKNYRQLHNALNALNAVKIQTFLILNPKVGQLNSEYLDLDEILRIDDNNVIPNTYITPTVVISAKTVESDLKFLEQTVDKFSDSRIAVIHWNFSDAKAVLTRVATVKKVHHLFVESPDLYMAQFSDCYRVYIHDGFIPAERNADYNHFDEFSDNHVTYQSKGLEGFGDFQTIGSSYSESGGAAYAVALHLTYIDQDMFNMMFCAHFVSETNDTPNDPGGKFIEALENLIARLRERENKIFESSAVVELRELYDRKHFPGLGYIKKLSILHHFELVYDFLTKES